MNSIVIRQPQMYPWGTPGASIIHRTDFFCLIFYTLTRVSLAVKERTEPGVAVIAEAPEQLKKEEVIVHKVFKIRLFKKHSEAETMGDLKKFI